MKNALPFVILALLIGAILVGDEILHRHGYRLDEIGWGGPGS